MCFLLVTRNQALKIVVDYSAENESRKAIMNSMFSHVFLVNINKLIYNESCQPEKKFHFFLDRPRNV